ncbi:hypothetical protein WJX81_006516 [Elliptochloris bilobata]|uniref:VPS9 domain-containing protein n=1 Tax=Elliptochloris bilobata TaxID=381761 RepID=A0AAW1RMJ0_9CHLO
MADPEALEEASKALSFAEFLERMKEPAAADLVRSIKSFIKIFEERKPDPDRDSALVQNFLAKSEYTFRQHPVWSSAPAAHQAQAVEGLEKYLMTKIYHKIFGVSELDRERDEALSLRMAALNFIQPKHLDIPELYSDEKAWQLAIKELHKINNYKAPRDKLVCILNCCRVINNLLHAAVAAGEARGADDFLPVLIFVVVHAAPPQLASNLEYIQRFRMQSRMASESAYFFTQLYSAASFIETINTNSLSMDADEFIARMVTAGGVPAGGFPPPLHPPPPPPQAPFPGVAELEREGAAAVVALEAAGQLHRRHRFVYAAAPDLRVADVSALLAAYKELALRYEALSGAVTARAGAGGERQLAAAGGPVTPLLGSGLGSGLSGMGAATSAPVESRSAGFGKLSEKKAAKRGKAAQKQQKQQNTADKAIGQAPHRPVDERYVAKQLELEGQPDADTEFQKRLERLRAATAATSEAAAAADAAVSTSILDRAPMSAGPAPRRAAPDNVESEGGGFGPGQIALAALPLVLAAVFVLADVDVGGGSAPQPTAAQQKRQLADAERAELQKQVAGFEARLAAEAGDREALRGGGAAALALGDAPRASELLTRLTEAAPGDAEAWQLLAEARGAAADLKGAAAAYERASAALPAPTLDVLQGLAGALVADAQPQRAVEVIKAERGRAEASPENGNPGPTTYELDMLLAKTYAQWSNHAADALKVYGGLIAQAPNDYRAYLARGVLLGSDGQKADAQRMFLQARFLAPPTARPVVDRVIANAGF